jgi:MscS family membrane protein
MDWNKWLRDRFKEPRQKWQDSEVLITGTNHNSEDGITYAEFNLKFFVAEIKL